MWLPTAQEMAAIDRAAVDSGAIPERSLIENAGRALATHVARSFPSGRVLVLAGSGHNGADALVAGRTLQAWGRQVTFLQCGGRVPTPDVLAGWGIELQSSDKLGAALSESSVALDGILGTGIETAPRPPQAEIIDRVNRAKLARICVDGPSGVNFTTGDVPGAAIRGQTTVTFGWPKLGLLRFPARSYCGDLVCVEIGFPALSPVVPRARAITLAWAAKLLGGRSAESHKGDAGYLAIVGGAPGMAGAVQLAARGATRAGAGIVRVVSAPENREILQAGVPEAVFVDWSDRGAVDETLEWADAVAVGPGLGRGVAEQRLAGEVVQRSPVPVVVDADGLRTLEIEDGVAVGGERGGPQGLLLTPHLGEAARLAGISIQEVRADPAGTASKLSWRTNATVVLKGAPTWIATPDGSLRVTTLISPAFGSGGVGDVLTGVCGAYFAAGMGAANAATSALAITGLATVKRLDQIGGSAADLPDAVAWARSAIPDVDPGHWPGVLLALPATNSTRSSVADSATPEQTT